MSAHRSIASGVATLASLIAMLAIVPTQASASLGEFTLTSTFDSFESEAVGVNQATNDVYVYHAGKISKYDADGNPVNFSSTGTNEIAAEGGGTDETEIAIDESGGATNGDIYLAGSFAGTHIFDSGGKPLGVLSEAPGVPWGEVACGVAVDHTGRVYLGVYPGHINEYVPSTNPATNADYTTTIESNEACNLAVDPEGSLYADTWANGRNGAIFKYAAQAGGNKLIEADGGGTVAVVNSPGAELFVGHHNEIQQFDNAGNLLSAFANPGSDQYVAVAIDAKNGRLYASNQTNKKVEIWQGVIVPAVETGATTNLEAAGAATLSGAVNPEGVSVESCSFQYGTSTSYGSSVACSQTVPLTGTSAVPVSAVLSGVAPNETYHYRLSTTDSHGVVNGADRTFTILVAPTVEDQQPSVSEIDRSAARLSGTVNPEHVDTRYRFEYGMTTDYGDRTAAVHTGRGIASDLSFSEQLENLIPGTIYHYRLVATNVGGTTFGADHTFTTGEPTPPVAVTGGASDIAQNVARITGAVDTNGLPTSYGFEIGTSTDYGPPTGLGYVGAGANEAGASLALTGLAPGTTYHYRLTATNVDGTVYGADQVFTTSVFASTFAEPPAPLPFVTVPPIVFPSEAKPLGKKPVKKTKKKVKKHSKAKGKKKPKSKKK
jgi:hypothetical protein